MSHLLQSPLKGVVKAKSLVEFWSFYSFDLDNLNCLHETPQVQVLISIYQYLLVLP